MRAWSGLLQCQQNRAEGVSRARDRGNGLRVSSTVWTAAPDCARRTGAFLAAQHFVQQIARALVALRELRRHRPQDDVAHRFRNAGIAQPRRRDELAGISLSRSAGAGVSYGSVPVSIWYIVTPSE